MAKNLDYIHYWGDDKCAVWVAPKGTTPPVGLAVPGTGWDEVGWIHSDGVSEGVEIDSSDTRAWQGGKIVKKKISANDSKFTFQALEENKATLGLRYRGQQPTVTGTGADAIATVHVTNQTATDERAFIFDFWDGTVQKRYVCPAGSHELTGDVTYSNNDPTALEFTVTPVGDFDMITNNPALTSA